MISPYDYLSIVFYFLFVIAVGATFARRNKNTSDYFRGGGIMPWWMAGVSAWMASFSAWTFTGAAGKIYDTGPYVLCLYYASIAPLIVVLIFTCYRFRRMRVVTPMEAIRMRFGPGTQQFCTWIRLPFLLIFGGVGLNTVGVFMSGAFDVNLTAVIITLGAMVTFISLVGGAFGVAASDFVQMFLVVTVTIVISVLALMQPSVGGIHGLVEKMPSSHFHWDEFARPEFVILWMVALAGNQLFALSSMENSAKYLMARSERHARLMLIFPIAGTLIGPLLWMLPPLVAAAVHSNADLRQLFPNLPFPQEGAFLATAHDVLPKGMLGFLLCGIFGATLSSMDASVNQGVGILVRNFYLPVINPQCPEKKLLIISKLSTALFGVIIVLIGLWVAKHRTLQLFDLLNQLGVSLWLPLAIPLSIGLFYKRTPPWSSWSTVLIGLTVSFLMKFGIRPHSEIIQLPTWISECRNWLQTHLNLPLPNLQIRLPGIVDVMSWIPGCQGPYKTEEITNFYIIATVAVVSIVCIAWFFFSSLFYESSSSEYKANVEEFFTRLHTPVESLSGEQVLENHGVAASIGKLCIIFGTFVLLMTAVPNSLKHRLCFVFVGGAMLGTGLLLARLYRPAPSKTTP